MSTHDRFPPIDWIVSLLTEEQFIIYAAAKLGVPVEWGFVSNDSLWIRFNLSYPEALAHAMLNPMYKFRIKTDATTD